MFPCHLHVQAIFDAVEYLQFPMVEYLLRQFWVDKLRKVLQLIKTTTDLFFIYTCNLFHNIVCKETLDKFMLYINILKIL